MGERRRSKRDEHDERSDSLADTEVDAAGLSVNTDLNRCVLPLLSHRAADAWDAHRHPSPARDVNSFAYYSRIILSCLNCLLFPKKFPHNVRTPIRDATMCTPGRDNVYAATRQCIRRDNVYSETRQCVRRAAHRARFTLFTCRDIAS